MTRLVVPAHERSDSMIGSKTMKFIITACGGSEAATMLIEATNRQIEESGLTTLMALRMYQAQSLIALGRLDFDTDEYWSCVLRSEKPEDVEAWKKISAAAQKHET